MGIITDNVHRLMSEIPDQVTLVAAVKMRSPEEVAEAVEAGITSIGENYVQEGEILLNSMGRRARFHFIGHLQRNKVKKAVEIFDRIENIKATAQLAADELKMTAFKRKKSQLDELRVDTLVTACANCRLVLEEGLEEYETELPVVGLTEMLADHLKN